MNFISGTHIPRRTFVRGMGASVALPLLDAMIPAGSHWNDIRGPLGVDRPRLIAIEEVHGSAGSTEFGLQQNLFAPAKIGRDFDLS